MFRVGIVGCGQVSRYWHMPAYKKLENVDVVATCDVDRSKLERFAKDFRIRKIFTDYKSLLDEELDVVDVCVPPHLHARIAKEAAKCKVDVIVEKPLALSSSQAQEVIQTCDKNRVRLCAIEDHLFFPRVQELKSLIHDDHLGSIISLSTVLRRGPLESDWRLDPNLSGGPLLEDGIHHAMLHVFFLEKIQAIYATVNDRRSVDRSIHFQVTLQAEDATGTMEFSCGPSVSEDYLELSGSKYSAHVDIYRNLLFINDGSNMLRLELKRLMNILREAAKYIFRKENFLVLGHYFQLKDFFESIKYNSEPALSGNLVKKGIMLIESAQKSITTGRVVKIMKE